jgi:hypothetical protein
MQGSWAHAGLLVSCPGSLDSWAQKHKLGSHRVVGLMQGSCNVGPLGSCRALGLMQGSYNAGHFCSCRALGLIGLIGTWANGLLGSKALIGLMQGSWAHGLLGSKAIIGLMQGS